MAKKYLIRLGEALRGVEVEEGPEGVRVCVDGRWHSISLEQIDQTGLFSLVVDDRPHEFFAEERSGGFDIVIGSRHYSVLLEAGEGRPPGAPRQALAAKPVEAGEWLLLSPMTGLVREIYVSPGDTVEVGDILMVIEAMKMNNDLKAQRSGQVKEVYVSKGQRVEEGTALLLLEQD